MRSSASRGITAPISFITMRSIGDDGMAASSMPSMPPMDVPTHATLPALISASRARLSARYCW